MSDRAKLILGILLTLVAIMAVVGIGMAVKTLWFTPQGISFAGSL